MPSEQKKQELTLPPPVAPTGAGEWKSKRKQGFMVTLPSGNAAKVRRTLDLTTLIKTGKIPNQLVSIVQDMVRKTEAGGNPMEAVNAEDFGMETLVAMTGFIDLIVSQVMVEPRCLIPPHDPEDDEWDPPGENTISIHDLDDEDKFFLFNMAQGGTSDLSTFREQQEAVMASAQAGGTPQREAKRTAPGRPAKKAAAKRAPAKRAAARK